MPRVKQAGDSALLLELEPVIDAEVNARAVAIAGLLRRLAPQGVRDVVSTYRSVAIYFDPLRTDADALERMLEGAHVDDAPMHSGRTIDVPVVYGGEGGPDLQDVAAFARLSPREVVARHTSVAYRVFMLGFLPGFAYLGSVPETIAAPRRMTPRVRVAAGSVGIAGRQTAIYPQNSPGGWQIIGRTEAAVFDARRTPAALFAPGDTVRFVAQLPSPEAAGATRHSRDAAGTEPAAAHDATVAERAVTVVRPGFFTTVQDAGRWGHQSLGVPVSGALDLYSHRLANALVGNAESDATLEVTVAGPELRIDSDCTIAVTGADLSASVGGAAIAHGAAIPCRRGDRLRFGMRRAGGRAYVAFSGGIAVPPVLGSRATHALSGLGGLGGRAIQAGDVLPTGPPARMPSRVFVPPVRVAGGAGARVRVLRGPQDDYFSEEAFELLQRNRFGIAANSDRMGYRLEGPRLPRLQNREMISDATFTGAIQVPASGEPILLMADRQTTGGYPQIGVVISADLPLAAQLVPGDWIEFAWCSRAEALSALVAQEGKLLAVR
jgi:KipI family sensor histidine kinase inhibitor